MILIGIRETKASGSYHGAEGFEGFSITASQVNVLAEGTKEILKSIIKRAKADLIEYKKKMEANEDRLNQFDERYDSGFDYDKEYGAIQDRHKNALLLVPGYDKLMIIEGEIL